MTSPTPARATPMASREHGSLAALEVHFAFGRLGAARVQASMSPSRYRNWWRKCERAGDRRRGDRTTARTVPPATSGWGSRGLCGCMPPVLPRWSESRIHSKLRCWAWAPSTRPPAESQVVLYVRGQIRPDTVGASTAAKRHLKKPRKRHFFLSKVREKPREAPQKRRISALKTRP